MEPNQPVPKPPDQSVATAPVTSQKKSHVRLLLILWLGALPTGILLGLLASWSVHSQTTAEFAKINKSLVVSVSPYHPSPITVVSSVLTFVMYAYFLFGWIPLVIMYRRNKK